jgi:hypothetical protein
MAVALAAAAVGPETICGVSVSGPAQWGLSDISNSVHYMLG